MQSGQGTDNKIDSNNKFLLDWRKFAAYLNLYTLFRQEDRNSLKTKGQTIFQIGLKTLNLRSNEPTVTVLDNLVIKIYTQFQAAKKLNEWMELALKLHTTYTNTAKQESYYNSSLLEKVCHALGCLIIIELKNLYPKDHENYIKDGLQQIKNLNNQKEDNRLDKDKKGKGNDVINNEIRNLYQNLAVIANDSKIMDEARERGLLIEYENPSETTIFNEIKNNATRYDMPLYFQVYIFPKYLFDLEFNKFLNISYEEFIEKKYIEFLPDQFKKISFPEFENKVDLSLLKEQLPKTSKEGEKKEFSENLLPSSQSHPNLNINDNNNSEKKLSSSFNNNVTLFSVNENQNKETIEENKTDNQVLEQGSNLSLSSPGNNNNN